MFENTSKVCKENTRMKQNYLIFRAYNNINGKERSTESDVVTIEVEGEPQLLDVTNMEAAVGEDVVMKIVLCSDPPPLVNTWQWGGGVVLPAGGEVDTRFKVNKSMSIDINLPL